MSLGGLPRVLPLIRVIHGPGAESSRLLALRRGWRLKTLLACLFWPVMVS
jgi:hypothetical protein